MTKVAKSISAEEHGESGMKCFACHNMTRQLCQAIYAPKKNHNMELKKLIKYNGEVELVTWGGSPGHEIIQANESGLISRSTGLFVMVWINNQ